MLNRTHMCIDHMLLSPTLSGAEEFADAHMHGAGARDNVLIVVGCCAVEYVGREPVKWQPPDTRVRYQTEDNNINLFVIYSYRLKPPEKMYVRFKTIEAISAHRLRDGSVLRITGVESDIADRIIRDPSVIEEGLVITDREKQTRSGAIDLHGVDRDHTPVIIEIKRSQLTPSAVLQLKHTFRPPAPTHRACEGSQDTVRIQHTSHDKNTANRERA